MIKKIMCISLAAFLSTSLLACGEKTITQPTTTSEAIKDQTDIEASPSSEATESATPTVISAFELGSVDAKTNLYQNNTLAMTLQLPKGWVITDEENLQKATLETFGSDTLYKFLLMAYDENGADELTTAHCDIRIAQSSDGTSMSSTLESQRELYLPAIEKGMTGVVVGDVEERTIGNQTVYYLRIETADPIVQEFLAFEKDGIAVQVYYYWSTEADGKKVQKSIDSLQLK